ncbi:CoA-binding protein [Balneola vulgaris]|uniref:CoA-binding protein n=1 Tax=Balneola vulgaris TaxID=287535 RepID=UPI00037AB813|nr:CoA-binding protein [Balneola vulgaris]
MPLTIPPIKEVLNNSKTIAVIGCSANPYRTSNYIAKFMQERGYEVIPVNPGHDEMIGTKCYRSLKDIPSDVQIDIINVFRSSEHTASVMDEVKEWNAKTGQNPVVWTQMDVSSPEAEEIAEEANIPYIPNKCIMVERERN